MPTYVSIIAGLAAVGLGTWAFCRKVSRLLSR